jgi:hypothetical protein
MQRSLGFELIVYGVLVPALSYLTYYFAPTMGRSAYLVGFTGGVLCFVWGVLALAGFRRVWPALLTLILTAFGALPAAVRLWMIEDPTGGERRVAAVIVTVILVFSIGLIAQISHTTQETLTTSKHV